MIPVSYSIQRSESAPLLQRKESRIRRLATRALGWVQRSKSKKIIPAQVVQVQRVESFEPSEISLAEPDESAEERVDRKLREIETELDVVASSLAKEEIKMDLCTRAIKNLLKQHPQQAEKIREVAIKVNQWERVIRAVGRAQSSPETWMRLKNTLKLRQQATQRLAIIRAHTEKFKEEMEVLLPNYETLAKDSQEGDALRQLAVEDKNFFSDLCEPAASPQPQKPRINRLACFLCCLKGEAHD